MLGSIEIDIVELRRRSCFGGEVLRGSLKRGCGVGAADPEHVSWRCHTRNTSCTQVYILHNYHLLSVVYGIVCIPTYRQVSVWIISGPQSLIYPCQDAPS